MSENTNKASGFGCIGSIIAVVLFASLNHSFWWGLLHFLLSWFYVVYVLLFRAKEIIPALTNWFS